MKPDIKSELNRIFSRALSQVFPGLKGDVEIILSNQPQFADYQCNSAMKLAKQVSLDPKGFAMRWCEGIRSNLDSCLIKHIEVAGPGFINIRLSSEGLASHLMSMLADEKCNIHADDIKKERVIVEFSSPNVAKQMHVGHLRSTIIGDCIARVFEFLGTHVLRLNHIGDWGTQFGMLIAFLKAEHPHLCDSSEKADLTALAGWYKESKKRFDDDEAFKKKSQFEVVALQSGHPDSLKVWKMICQISRENYQEIYDLLGVTLKERGESFYNLLLPEVVNDLTQKGLIEISDEAKCLFLEGFVNREGKPLPMIIQKSDGGFNYSSTDMAAMRHRVQVEGANRIIVLTDAGQRLHFQMILKAAEKAGYLKDYNGCSVRFDHVTFGLVLGKDGKKIKTRAGNTEPLIHLINTAIEKAKKIITLRDHQLTEAEQECLAHVLGINAIKYVDLVNHRESDYKFSYERMLRFEGNTAGFLMYAYVRILSIKRKVIKQRAASQVDDGEVIKLLHPSEYALGLHLARFDEVIVQLVDDLLPHRLCEYLYHLAECFNAFFRDCHVEGSKEEASRLRLCELTGKVLLTGMQLLGLNVVERM